MSIKIENVDIFGWEGAIRGARNPMNSWEQSDSRFWERSREDEEHPFGINYYHNILKEHFTVLPEDDEVIEGILHVIESNDHKLLMNLSKGGPEESKWRRMVHVQMDITAPLYWWKEFDTYKVGTTSNSCSTMHKIQAKELILDDFSCEHLITENEAHELEGNNPEYLEEACLIAAYRDDGTINVSDYMYPEDILRTEIQMFNQCRDLYLQSKDKRYWWQMIQLLPSSYNQRRTIDLNYEVLASQYEQRKDHKLDEWREYCDWIKTLPYSELITGEETE